MSQTMEDFAKVWISKIQDGLEIEKDDEDGIKNASNLDSSDNIKKETINETTAMADASLVNSCTKFEDEFERNTAEEHASKYPSTEVRSTVKTMSLNPTGDTLRTGSWDRSRPYEQGFKDSFPKADNLTEKATSDISSSHPWELHPDSVFASISSSVMTELDAVDGAAAVCRSIAEEGEEPLL